MKYLYFIILSLLLFSCESNNVNAQDEFETRDAITGLDTPWEILWGPDDHIWFTERYGRISKADPETGDVQELFVIDNVFENGERGLMGMVLHPDFENNPFVYVAYNTGSNNENTEIVLARLTYDGEKLSDLQVILDGIQGWWNHDGSRLWILEDNTLLMTIGDAAKQDWAQDNSNLNGTIIRINLDGSIPDDNPIEGSRIYIYGSRNAQGLVVHDDIIYSSEHGPDTDDEVNIIYPGRNYGWPQVRGFCNTPSEQEFCEANNVVEPIAAWTPTLAVAGIDFYDHDLIEQWNNSILVTSLKAGTLVQLKLDESATEVVEEKHFFKGQFGRLRDVCVSPDGRLFIATSNRDGRGAPKPQDDRIIEIKPKSTSVDSDKGSLFDMYPNPADDNVMINNYGDFSQVKIFDQSGNLVREFNNSFNKINWDLKDNSGKICSNGLYNVVLFGNEIISKKLIINR
jgi:glucose/arabinose dehydrogenase